MIELDSFGILTLQEGDVLVVRASALNNMPVQVRAKHINEIHNTLSTLFLSNRILVVPSDMEFSILREAVKSAETQS